MGQAGGTLTDVTPADYTKETDFYTHVTKVLSGKPDAILLIGASEPTALIVKQARELGFQGKFILGDQAKLDEMVKVVPIEKLEGAIAVTPLYHRPIKDAPTFTQIYKKRFGEGEVSTFEAASHYETLYLLAYAMEIAGTSSQVQKIRAAMPQVFPSGETGHAGPHGSLWTAGERGPAAHHLWNRGDWRASGRSPSESNTDGFLRSPSGSRMAGLRHSGDRSVVAAWHRRRAALARNRASAGRPINETIVRDHLPDD